MIYEIPPLPGYLKEGLYNSLFLGFGVLGLLMKSKHRAWGLVMRSKHRAWGDDDDGWEDHHQRSVRSWEDLPGLALLNIFCKTDFNDRLVNIPLVCRSWRSALQHPHCWSSMLPDSVSPEDAFIKMNHKLFPDEVRYHLKHLKTLIERSGGGSAITSLYLQPFLRGTNECHHHPPFDIHSYGRYRGTVFEIFRFVAKSCPNLKHISFRGPPYHIGPLREAVHLIFNKCKWLELVDFGDSKEFDSPDLIQKMGSHLPLLRGIRIGGPRYSYDAPKYIAENLPWLKLLSLPDIYTNEIDTASCSLSKVLSKCVDLQYLNAAHYYCIDYYIGDCEELIDQASARIAEFHWCGYSRCEDSDYCRRSSKCWCCGSWGFCRNRHCYYLACCSKECYECEEECCEREEECCESEVECCESDENRADDYEWFMYDDEHYSFKEERSYALFQNRAKDRRRREFIFLQKVVGKKCDLRRRSKCKPLTEYELAYANDSYVIPVRR